MEGYLTTGGLDVEDTHQMITDLGFEVETIQSESQNDHLLAIGTPVHAQR